MPRPPTPDRSSIVDALERLADRVEYGHLLLSTDAVAFLDAVNDEIMRLQTELEAAQHWIEASVAPRNRTGLAYYLTRHGKRRTVRAVCVSPKSVMYDGDDDDFGDYDEATGEYYLPAGWYERVENGDYDYYPIDGTVTHFMPLPAPPLWADDQPLVSE